MTGQWLYMFCGVWALGVLAIFIQAIRLSYKIEARSPDLRNTSGLPRKAMWIHTMLNLRVARDAETQAMRRRMNRLFLCNLVGFAILWIGIRLTYEAGP